MIMYIHATIHSQESSWASFFLLVLLLTSDGAKLPISRLSELHNQAGQDLIRAGELILCGSYSTTANSAIFIKGGQYLKRSGQALVEAARELDEDNWEGAVLNGIIPASAAVQSSVACFEDIKGAREYLQASANALDKIGCVTGCVVMASAASSDYLEVAESVAGAGKCFRSFDTQREIFVDAGNALVDCGGAFRSIYNYFSR